MSRLDRIKVSCWQVTLIVFFLVGSPIFILGLVAGFMWDMLRVGFFWGGQFIDALVDKDE